MEHPRHEAEMHPFYTTSGKTVLVDPHLFTSVPFGQGIELAPTFLLSLLPLSACTASEAMVVANVSRSGQPEVG